MIVSIDIMKKLNEVWKCQKNYKPRCLCKDTLDTEVNPRNVLIICTSQLLSIQID